MPIMDGYVATQRIREWERARQARPAPILALSAYALQSEIDKSREAGCTTYLTKPIRRKTLLEALEKYSDATRGRPDQVKPPGRIQPTLDERLRSIVPVYLEGRRRDILTVLAALDNDDFEQIRTIGHKNARLGHELRISRNYSDRSAGRACRGESGTRRTFEST